MNSRKSKVKLLVYTEIILYLIPISINFMMGIEQNMLPFLVSLWTTGQFDPVLDTICLGWWLITLRGLMSLWKLFLKYDGYTLDTVPIDIKVGLTLGLVSILSAEFTLSPLGAVGYPTLYPTWLAGIVVLQFGIILKYNVVIPKVLWHQQLQLALLTSSPPDPENSQIR